MTRCTLFGLTAVVALIAAASANPAAAASAVTFVSGKGVDTGACTRAAPCRNFQFAYNQTTAGGIVSALDAAGYGPVVITQSVTIAGPGNGRASIAARGGGNGNTGIDIEAPGGTVVLRGLEIDGGANGINVGQAASVIISDTTIVGASNLSINVRSGVGAVSLQNTTISGAEVDTSATSFVAKRVKVSSNTAFGLKVLAGTAALDDCLVSGASGTNVLASGGTAIIKHTALSFAGTKGIDAGSGSALYVDTTTIFGSGSTGLVASGTVFSYGNNNFPDGTSGTITPIAGD